MWVAGWDPTQASPYDFKIVQGRQISGGQEVIVERNWARDRDLGVGDLLRVAAPAGTATLRIAGVFEFSSGLSFGGAGLAGMPLGPARRLFDQPEGYNTISVRLRDRGDVDRVQAGLERRLGGAVEIQTPSQVAGDVKDQLKALDVVLLLFSGMALFVGGFLILNSFTMTVLQRTRELGMLRTLGAPRGAIARSVLVEAALLAVLGTAAGLAVGLLMAQGLIALLRGIGVPVGNLSVGSGAVVTAVLAGMVATLAGAALPARRAARVSPIQAAQGGGLQAMKRPGPRRLVLALALFLPGFLFGGDYWFGDQNGGGALWGFGGIAGTMAMFAGMVLAAPFAIPPLVRAIGVPMRRIFPTAGRLAVDAATSNPMRTAATAIALSVGLSVLVVDATMSSSFVKTVNNQVSASFQRDLTVQPMGQGLDRGGAQVVPRRLALHIAALPESGVTTTVRVGMIDLPGVTTQKTGFVEGLDPEAWGKVDSTPLVGASRDEALKALAAGAVIVGQRYAERAGLHPGDQLVLRGPRGLRRARIVALRATVADVGDILMSRATMAGVYGITQEAQIVVKARSAQDRAPLEAAVRKLIERRYPAMEALSTAELKDQIDREISQQFNMFNAILAIAVLVSLLGVVNTLVMSVLERTREIGVLRALGASRWHVRWTMVAESILVTLSSAIAGLASGLVIAWMWTRGLDRLLPGLVFSVPVAAAVGIAIAAVVLGAAAAVLPARRAARMDVVRALGAE
jgi:putative ABC transport system permease protein